MKWGQATIDLQRNGGLNCAQAILTVLGPRVGISPATAKMLGRPWGGGMAQQGLTCGYLTGAMLVMARAWDDEDEDEARKKVGQGTRELFRRFTARRGSTFCRDLLGADMSTPEGAQCITAENRVKQTCCNPGGIGQEVAEIVADLINS